MSAIGLERVGLPGSSSTDESLAGAATETADSASSQRLTICPPADSAFQQATASVGATASHVEDGPHLRRGLRVRKPTQSQAEPTGLVSAPPPLASSRTQLALACQELSVTDVVIQSSVVHRALYRLATVRGMSDAPPQLAATTPSGRSPYGNVTGRKGRRDEKKRDVLRRQATADGRARFPTAFEVACFAEMSAPGTSLVALFGADTADTETVFGAEQDGTSAVVDAVMAVLSARRLDSEGRVLAPPMILYMHMHTMPDIMHMHVVSRQPWSY